MSEAFQIDGAWPGVVTLRRGWSRATARPWNKATGIGTLRLIRGSASFLAAASEWTAGTANGTVLSPALYSSATRAWKKAGYQPMLQLSIMETNLGPTKPDSERVDRFEGEDLSPLAQLDHLAFDTFWHMDEAGLREALLATPRAVVFQARVDDSLAGYAIVGSQLGISFLQRIAVSPQHQGGGIGSDLLKAAMAWAGGSGAATMVLNVRDDNEEARRLYLKHGFASTRTALRVLRYDA